MAISRFAVPCRFCLPPQLPFMGLIDFFNQRLTWYIRIWRKLFNGLKGHFPCQGYFYIMPHTHKWISMNRHKSIIVCERERNCQWQEWHVGKHLSTQQQQMQANTPTQPAIHTWRCLTDTQISHLTRAHRRRQWNLQRGYFFLGTV